MLAVAAFLIAGLQSRAVEAETGVPVQADFGSGFVAASHGALICFGYDYQVRCYEKVDDRLTEVSRWTGFSGFDGLVLTEKLLCALEDGTGRVRCALHNGAGVPRSSAVFQDIDLGGSIRKLAVWRDVICGLVELEIRCVRANGESIPYPDGLNLKRVMDFTFLPNGDLLIYDESGGLRIWKAGSDPTSYGGFYFVLKDDNTSPIVPGRVLRIFPSADLICLLGDRSEVECFSVQFGSVRDTTDSGWNSPRQPRFGNLNTGWLRWVRTFSGIQTLVSEGENLCLVEKPGVFRCLAYRRATSGLDPFHEHFRYDGGQAMRLQGILPSGSSGEAENDPAFWIWTTTVDELGIHRARLGLLTGGQKKLINYSNVLWDMVDSIEFDLAATHLAFQRLSQLSTSQERENYRDFFKSLSLIAIEAEKPGPTSEIQAERAHFLALAVGPVLRNYRTQWIENCVLPYYEPAFGKSGPESLTCTDVSVLLLAEDLLRAAIDFVLPSVRGPERDALIGFRQNLGRGGDLKTASQWWAWISETVKLSPGVEKTRGEILQRAFSSESAAGVREFVRSILAASLRREPGFINPIQQGGMQR